MFSDDQKIKFFFLSLEWYRSPPTTLGVVIHIPTKIA